MRLQPADMGVESVPRGMRCGVESVNCLSVGRVKAPFGYLCFLLVVIDCARTDPSTHERLHSHVLG